MVNLNFFKYILLISYLFGKNQVEFSGINVTSNSPKVDIVPSVVVPDLLVIIRREVEQFVSIVNNYLLQKNNIAMDERFQIPTNLPTDQIVAPFFPIPDKFYFKDPVKVTHIPEYLTNLPGVECSGNGVAFTLTSCD